jgi:nucleoside-diphosphate-sugar epimerase
MTNSSITGLLGARGLVGESLLSLLTHQNRDVVAFSRSPSEQNTKATLRWHQLDNSSDLSQDQAAFSNINQWLCVAPIWVLPQYFSMLESIGVRKVVALSSTSRFIKNDSSDPEEQAIAMRLADAEAQMQVWAERHGVEWIILRPTLIYGLGRDKNVSEIVRFVRRFGFFPLFGEAKGLRQPIHVQDVASACIAALDSSVTANRAYNLSGAETLTYREMVRRIFGALNRPVRLLPVPLIAFRFAVSILRFIPRYRNWSSAMAERMNRDLVFDHSEATRDFGFKPRPFLLNAEDVDIK